MEITEVMEIMEITEIMEIKVEVSLSSQARNGIGLREGPVVVKSYSRPVIVPGIIVQKPGRSQYTVIAPITGYVTQVYRTPGGSVLPGDPLFELRLTHEELVQSQVELLATSEALDVVQRELRRLESINTEGLIAKKEFLTSSMNCKNWRGGNVLRGRRCCCMDFLNLK